MPRKPKEVEQEIDVTQVPKKKETFATRWFRDHAVNNATELKYVCDLTARSAKEQFKLNVTSDNTEVFAVVFYVTFMTILDFIRSKQKSYNNFTIEIFNSINVGYTNNDDDENEKVGNFMPIMEYISINRTVVDDGSHVTGANIASKFIQWKQLNAKQEIDYCKEIEHRAYDTLEREYKISLRTEEAIVPLFCIFMDHISNVVRQMYRELKDTDVSEVSMNVLGLFDVFYSFDEENGQECVDFQPNISMKLKLKADDVAARD